MPYFGVRSAADIIRISNSPELAQWDIPGGYSRPICRRVVESAGVPRSLFGVKKRYASTWIIVQPEFLTESSTVDYLTWLKEDESASAAVRSLPISVLRRIDQIVLKLVRTVEGSARRMRLLPGYYRLGLDKIRFLRWAQELLRTDVPKGPYVPIIRRHVFRWSVDRVASKYRGDQNAPANSR